MTLADVSLPVPYDQCKDLAIVYSYDIAVLWYGIQQQHGDPRHVATGEQLTDGRWMLGGHLLSELYTGGILGWAVPHLTPEIREQIEIVPRSSVEVVPTTGPE